MPSLFESDSIMPTRLDSRRNCWKSRSSLEKILILIIVITTIVIIILAILLNQKSNLTTRTCNTKACLNEAANIIQYIDPEINPCDNFYKFACGNFLKSTHGDETLNFLTRMEMRGRREVLEVYREPIREDEHFMVKRAKQLFQACMSENQMESQNIKSIKDTISLAGGWPVLEEARWNDTKFDWLEATYKLRKLGFQYSAFLDLKVEPDGDGYKLKVDLPDVFDYSSHNFDKLDFMVETALAFGATNRDKITAEMQLVHNFLIDLQLQTHNHYGHGNSTMYTVSKYQQKYGVIDWLQFLNNLTNPVLVIRKNDTVIFPPAPVLKSWIDLITRTPKRIQANFIMWTVIEKILPYLSDKYQNYNIVWKKPQTLQETCLERIHDKFVPNPIDIVCDRKYLPLENKNKVEKIASHIKSEFEDQLMQAKRPDKLQKLAKEVQLVVGRADDYFSDNILDKISVDMVNNDDKSFISLLAQANRNKQSKLFTQVRKNSNSYSYPSTLASFPTYYKEKNALFLSSLFTEGEVFNPDRPNYLNYGTLGTSIGHQLSRISNQFQESEKIKCILKAMNDYTVSLSLGQVDIITQFSVGAKLAYGAYEKNFGNDEKALIGLDYNTRQLFWISMVSILCEPTNSFSPIDKNNTLISAMVSGFIRNHPKFATDFSCGENTRMYPKNKCNLL